MRDRSAPLRFATIISVLVLLNCSAQVFQLVPLNAPQSWQMVEFRVLGVPVATNPFDPAVIRVDALFSLPSGQTSSVPAFWYQTYQRNLSGGTESLYASAPPEWRLRYMPSQAGAYSVTLTVTTNGQPCGLPATTQFTVNGAPPARTGFVRIAPSGQYFETGDSQPLPLVGANVCWPGSRGTFDYDDWFAAMQTAGQNYARLWMCPWFFGIENQADSLNRYRLDRAWQLDYVLSLAGQRGIYLELCLDYHGMFALEPDYWGGNNYWPANPYNVTNGGPCIHPNAFFTNTTARTIYQKRLRYLVARYGCSPNLLSWQFFNEIDNVYSLLNPNDVANWHRLMARWMGTNDPYGHLVTTSFTYAHQHPEIWSLPEIDYACLHAYGPSAPATHFSTMTSNFLNQFSKPVLVDEYGTSWQGWNRPSDPYLRGFRQGLWGGALGGSVGTSMSWWWEKIHSENVYPAFAALNEILRRTGWGRGTWRHIDFNYSSTPPPNLGDPLPGEPATVTLPLDHGWGTMLAGRLAVPGPEAADFSAGALNSFIHGSTHTDLRVPFRLDVWLTNNARLIMHLNSVSWNPAILVRADGTELLRTNLPNLDGTYVVNNEYNLDIPVNLPPGRHTIEILNAGADWFYLDWVRLEGVLPSSYAGNWRPSPHPIGLRGPHEALAYVVAPGTAFPAGATEPALPQQMYQTVTLTNWTPGVWFAEWYDPASGALAGRSQAVSAGNQLTLTLPPFYEDLAGVIYPPPSLAPLGLRPFGTFDFQLVSETGGVYEIQRSVDLINWTPVCSVTNYNAVVNLAVPVLSSNSMQFLRAVR